MLQSKLFSKTRRDIDKEEVAKNAQILIKAGFIDKTMAGVYTLLPLGFRVIKKIEHIIREEMEAIGGQEILMPALHPKAVWETSGRWETEDNLFRFTSYYTKLEFAFGATHEEIVTPLAKKIVLSYKDLPRYVFQIQTKFRDEQRAKSGILRGREFIMKDLYSFHADEKDLNEYYKRVEQAYTNIFNRVGIGEKTYKTYAAGGSFSKYSHEYQTISDVGEDLIHLCTSCQIAINDEIFADSPTCPECNSKDFTTHASIEVGNIFKLKTKFSKAFNLKFSDVNGQENEVLMGCYGIGLGRLMGTAVELLAQDEKMMWPKTIAPFSIHLIELISTDVEVHQKAQKLYQELKDRNIEVLYDNRDERAGVKFHDADLIGIPTRIIVSQKSLEKGGFEVNGQIYTSLKN